MQCPKCHIEMKFIRYGHAEPNTTTDAIWNCPYDGLFEEDLATQTLTSMNCPIQMLRRVYREIVMIMPKGVFRALKKDIEKLSKKEIHQIPQITPEDVLYLRSIPDLKIHTDFDPDLDTTHYQGKAMTHRQYYALTNYDLIDAWLHFEKLHSEDRS